METTQTTRTRKSTGQATAVTQAKTNEASYAECLCGCGEMVGGKKSRFRPGHDARHHSNLVKAWIAGDDAVGAELIERGWETQDKLDARRTATEKAAAKSKREAEREARAKARAEKQTK